MKILAFVAEIFAKKYWCFLIVDFQCIFHISSIMHLRKLQRWIINEWFWPILEIMYQNAIDSVKIKDLSKLLRCFIGWEISHLLWNTLYIHLLNTFSFYTLFIHLLYTPSLFIFYIHFLYAPFIYTFYIHPLYTPSIFTLYIHILYSPSIYTFYIHSLFTPSIHTLFIYLLYTPSIYTFYMHSHYPPSIYILLAKNYVYRMHTFSSM